MLINGAKCCVLSSPCVDVFSAGLIIMEINCGCQVPRGLQGKDGQYGQIYLIYRYCYCNIQERLLLSSSSDGDCVRLYSVPPNRAAHCVVFLPLLIIYNVPMLTDHDSEILKCQYLFCQDVILENSKN